MGKTIVIATLTIQLSTYNCILHMVEHLNNMPTPMCIMALVWNLDPRITSQLDPSPRKGIEL